MNNILRQLPTNPGQLAIEAGYYNPYENHETKLSMEYVHAFEDFQIISVSNIQNNVNTRTFQSRKSGYSRQNLQDVESSIAAEGLKDPIFVKFMHFCETTGEPIYRVVSGHHRHMAHINLKLKSIPCFVISFNDQSQKLDFEQAENRDKAPRKAHTQEDAVLYLTRKNDIGAFNKFGTSWEKKGGRYKEVMRLLSVFYTHMNGARKGRIFKEFLKHINHNSSFYDYSSIDVLKQVEGSGFTTNKAVGESTKTNKQGEDEVISFAIFGRAQNLRTSLSELMIKIQKKTIEINSESQYKIHCFITIDNPTPATIKSRRENFMKEDLKAWNSIFKTLEFPVIENVTFLKQIKNKEAEHLEYLFKDGEFTVK